MKKTAPSKRNPMTDDRIDQYCSHVEKLLQNLKSKSNKSQNNDYLLDKVLYDNLMED